MLAKFTQLKRFKRFDDFIMLVRSQGPIFHVAAGSHPVQEAYGSQNRSHRGQIKLLLQFFQNPYLSLVVISQKKYSLTYL